jgi:hypothetical protein
MMHVPGQATEPATGSSESCLPQWQLLPAVSGLWIGQPEATTVGDPPDALTSFPETSFGKKGECIRGVDPVARPGRPLRPGRWQPAARPASPG